MNSLRVLLVGEESAGLQTLKLVANSAHRLVGVLASPTPASRVATVWTAAEKLGIPTWPAERVRDSQFAEEIECLEVDLLLNVHSLYVVRGEVISACRIGAFNLHPGPLPAYAGLNVPSWAIYHGETQHAVTLHEMTPEIDAGTITYESSFPIDAGDTGFSLMAKCIRSGVPLVERLLAAAAAGCDHIPRRVQDFSQRRYFGRQAPNDGQLDWCRPAAQIANHVRASDYSPFPSPWGAPETWMGTTPVGIIRTERTGATAVDAVPGTVRSRDSRSVEIATGDEWLAVPKVLLDGQVRQAADVLEPGEVLRGLPLAAVCC